MPTSQPPARSVQDLVGKYPELCLPRPGGRKTPFAFETGNGWYDLLDALLASAVSGVRAAEHRVSRLREARTLGKASDEQVLAAEQAYSSELEKLPELAQVKEKFGGLRFYVDGASEELRAQIALAEMLSFRICEVCGAPGSLRREGWFRTLCDGHYEPPRGAA